MDGTTLLLFRLNVELRSGSGVRVKGARVYGVRRVLDFGLYWV